MEKADVRAAYERLGELFTPFAWLFGKSEARGHAREYISGLLSSLERKSVEPIARAFGGGRVSALQKFINAAPWKPGMVYREIQREFAARAWAHSAGPVVSSVATYRFVKRGRESVGVGAQWNEKIRRSENCQVGVFLIAAVPGASCLLDARLYLPEPWCADSEEAARRRVRTRVPPDTTYRTRSQIALDLLRRALATGLVDPGWLVATEGFGGDGDILQGAPMLGERALVEVPLTETVFTSGMTGPHYSFLPSEFGHVRTEPRLEVGEIFRGLPLNTWRTGVALAEAGVSRGDYATLSVRSPRLGVGSKPIWLVLTGGPGRCGERRAFLSSSPNEPEPDELAKTLAAADSGLAFHREADELLGLSHYETRSWVGWHHHMSLVALAHWLATTARG